MSPYLEAVCNSSNSNTAVWNYSCSDDARTSEVCLVLCRHCSVYGWIMLIPFLVGGWPWLGGWPDQWPVSSSEVTNPFTLLTSTTGWLKYELGKKIDWQKNDKNENLILIEQHDFVEFTKFWSPSFIGAGILTFHTRPPTVTLVTIHRHIGLQPHIVCVVVVGGVRRVIVRLVIVG